MRFLFYCSCFHLSGQCDPSWDPLHEAPKSSYNLAIVFYYIAVWILLCTQSYSMAVYLVKQQSSSVLLQRLRSKGIRNPDHSRALSKDHQHRRDWHRPQERHIHYNNLKFRHNLVALIVVSLTDKHLLVRSVAKFRLMTPRIFDSRLCFQTNEKWCFRRYTHSCFNHG